MRRSHAEVGRVIKRLDRYAVRPGNKNHVAAALRLEAVNYAPSHWISRGDDPVSNCVRVK